MNRLTCCLAALVLMATAAAAGPELGALPGSADADPQACPFSRKDATGNVVLLLKHAEASMVLEGKLLRLRVEELDCMSNCVAPGRSGVRTFLLTAPEVRVRLTKGVTCHKDSEVCGGLPEGEALLRVSTASGETALQIWGKYCDL